MRNVNFIIFLTDSSNIFHIFVFYFLKGTLIKQTIIKQQKNQFPIWLNFFCYFMRQEAENDTSFIFFTIAKNLK